MNGYIEELKIDDQLLQLSGWAFDAERDRPLQRLLVFDGTRLMAQARPTEIRKDVAQKFGSYNLLKTGFRLSTSAVGVDLSDVRVIIVSGDSAAELPHP